MACLTPALYATYYLTTLAYDFVSTLDRGMLTITYLPMMSPKSKGSLGQKKEVNREKKGYNGHIS